MNLIHVSAHEAMPSVYQDCASSATEAEWSCGQTYIYYLQCIDMIDLMAFQMATSVCLHGMMSIRLSLVGSKA